MKKLNLLLAFLLLSIVSSAQYSGTGPLTLSGIPAGATGIQWYKDGAVISGATNPTYAATIPGQYYASYTDASTTCTDDRTVLFVLLATGENVQLQGTTNNGGGSNYQWYNDGTEVASATSPDYTATTGGLYSLKYDNGTCIIESQQNYVFLLELDTDGDGIADAIDQDDDNDGISDATEGTADTDGDGVIDAKDLDADNDGINDVIEAGGTDANGDGKQDGTPNATTGQIGTGLTPPNSDNDTVPDYKDLDSDNDGVSDLQEGGSNGTDANNDGVVDGPDTDGDGIPNSVDGLAGFGDASSPALPNGDSDTIPDYRDVDSDGDGIKDIVEKAGKGTLDANNDGMVDSPTDPDGDGIANNSGLDTIPAGFGGLPTATGPACNAGTLAPILIKN